MRFALTDEQRGFGRLARPTCSPAPTPSAAARAWAAGDTGPGLTLWKRLAEQGVDALAGPRGRTAASAATPVDLVVAFEALGRHAVPGPWVESAAYLPDRARPTSRSPRGGRARSPCRRTCRTPSTPTSPTHVLRRRRRRLHAATAGAPHALRRPGPAAVRGRPPATRCESPATCERGLRPGRAGAARRSCSGSASALLADSVDLRQAAQAVRPRDRLLPGDQAPAGRRADRARLRPAAGLRRGAGSTPTRRATSRPPRSPRARRGVPRRPGGAAGARRDRLHRGVRPAASGSLKVRALVDGLGHAGVPPRPGRSTRSTGGADGLRAAPRSRTSSPRPCASLLAKRSRQRGRARGRSSPTRATTRRCGGCCASRSAWRRSRSPRSTTAPAPRSSRPRWSSRSSGRSLAPVPAARVRWSPPRRCCAGADEDARRGCSPASPPARSPPSSTAPTGRCLDGDRRRRSCSSSHRRRALRGRPGDARARPGRRLDGPDDPARHRRPTGAAATPDRRRDAAARARAELVGAVGVAALQVGCAAARPRHDRRLHARSGCSSAGRSAPSRRSSTGWPTCSSLVETSRSASWARVVRRRRRGADGRRPSCAARREVVVLRRARPRRRRDRAAARRHRDHLGARRPAGLQARPRPRPALRLGARAPGRARALSDKRSGRPTGRWACDTVRGTFGSAAGAPPGRPCGR